MSQLLLNIACCAKHQNHNSFSRFSLSLSNFLKNHYCRRVNVIFGTVRNKIEYSQYASNIPISDVSHLRPLILTLRCTKQHAELKSVDCEIMCLSSYDSRNILVHFNLHCHKLSITYLYAQRAQ